MSIHEHYIQLVTLFAKEREELKRVGALIEGSAVATVWEAMCVNPTCLKEGMLYSQAQAHVEWSMPGASYGDERLSEDLKSEPDWLRWSTDPWRQN